MVRVGRGIGACPASQSQRYERWANRADFLLQIGRSSVDHVKDVGCRSPEQRRELSLKKTSAPMALAYHAMISKRTMVIHLEGFEERPRGFDDANYMCNFRIFKFATTKQGKYKLCIALRYDFFDSKTSRSCGSEPTASCCTFSQEQNSCKVREDTAVADLQTIISGAYRSPTDHGQLPRHHESSGPKRELRS